MSKNIVVNPVVVANIDELLIEIAGKTAELAAVPGAKALEEVKNEWDKQYALDALEALQSRRVTEAKLVQMDKTNRLDTLVKEVATLRKLGESGKYVGSVFIKALPSTHPAMVRKQEIEAILADGLREANATVEEAIRQQLAYCKQMGYELPSVRTTSNRK